MATDPREGAGPFQFSCPELATGETWHLDFRDEDRNGRAGGYRPLLPFDSLVITNRSTEPLETDINGRFSSYVVPNAVESSTDLRIVRVYLTNDGSGTVSAGEVRVEVERTPYDRDDEVRERLSRPWWVRAVDDLVPGGLQ
jgi:hypothetical protein